ncbi:hypothetical protein V8E51_002949 [Hyaloscypha variabilis]
MDQAQGWNFDDYSHFFADESFNLFGDCNLDFDFNNELAPGFDEANNAFDLGEWDEPPAAVDSASTVLNVQPSTLADPEITTSSNQTIQESQRNGDSSSSLTRVLITEDPGQIDHPPESQIQNESQSKAQTTKRKYFTAFSASSGDEVRQHTRRKFSEEQKKVVALNRMMGVCLHCRLRKVACDDGIPCNRCIKRAGSISSGQEICMRRGLVETRFDHIDLLRIAIVESKVKDFSSTPAPQPVGWGYIGFPANADTYCSEAYIKVPLIDFEPFGFQRTREILSVNYYRKSCLWVRNTSQAIFPGAAPTADRLLQAYLISRENCLLESSPFSRLWKASRDFAEKYCDTPSELPLKGLLSKSLKLQRLFHLSRALPSIKSSPSGKDSELVSNFMWLQLRLPICIAIKETEAYVLAEADKLMNNKIGIGRENPLAAWAVLWILIFAYKEHMIFRKGCCDDFESETIYSLSQHLYNMLTSMYAALYKTTSPLTLDWRSKEVAAMLGNDADLITLFCNIKTEMFWFQSHKHELFPEDTLFRTLIVENENKLLAAHIKKAKQQGII